MPNVLPPLEWHPHRLVKSACASSAPSDVRVLMDALAVPGAEVHCGMARRGKGSSKALSHRPNFGSRPG
jgi:hypothetical protein